MLSDGFSSRLTIRLVTSGVGGDTIREGPDVDGGVEGRSIMDAADVANACKVKSRVF